MDSATWRKLQASGGVLSILAALSKITLKQNSEVCHPRCEFKLYGKANSVKKHNYKLWLNDGIY